MRNKQKLLQSSFGLPCLIKSNSVRQTPSNLGRVYDVQQGKRLAGADKRLTGGVKSSLDLVPIGSFYDMQQNAKFFCAPRDAQI